MFSLFSAGMAQTSVPLLPVTERKNRKGNATRVMLATPRGGSSGWLLIEEGVQVQSREQRQVSVEGARPIFWVGCFPWPAQSICRFSAIRKTQRTTVKALAVSAATVV
jgi:hypothetical protein